MRISAVLFSFSVLTVHAQLDLSWRHRFDPPSMLTGFGDVGLGLDRRNDSLVVGHTWENRAHTTLFNAGIGDIHWTMPSNDTVAHYGGRRYFGGGILSAQRVAGGSSLTLRSATLGLDGTSAWSDDAGLMDVQLVRGPLVNTTDNTAIVLAYGNGVLHGRMYDHAGLVASWQHTSPIPWTSLDAMVIDGDDVLVTAMVDHPSAFTDVPRLMRVDGATGNASWANHLSDTTGFLVNAPAITAHWNADTLLSIHTTYSGQVVLRMTDADDGAVLWSFTDTLETIPELASMAVVPVEGTVFVALRGGNTLAYSPSGGRLWMDTLHTQAPYARAMILANADHLIHIITDRQHTDQGQDVRVRALDPTTGVLLDEAWVNDTVNTHDLLENALLHGDVLHLLTAATFDTLSILNESTTLLLTTFDLSTTTHLPEDQATSDRTNAVIGATSLQPYMDPQCMRWTLRDTQGRVVAHGDRHQVDARYVNASGGLFLLTGCGGRRVQLFVKP